MQAHNAKWFVSSKKQNKISQIQISLLLFMLKQLKLEKLFVLYHKILKRDNVHYCVDMIHCLPDSLLRFVKSIVSDICWGNMDIFIIVDVIDVFHSAMTIIFLPFGECFLSISSTRITFFTILVIACTEQTILQEGKVEITYLCVLYYNQCL